MHVNAGDTAWMLAATAMVFFMMPGLAFFYGGLVDERNVLSTMAQSFVAIGIISVLWIVIGYSLVFGPDHAGIIGGFQFFMLRGVGNTPTAFAPTIPPLLFMAFQMKFAVITPALIAGAFIGRMRFSGYLAFIGLWSLLVYCPFAHWVWGGGFLGASGLHAIDFAGGSVVHELAGASALGDAAILRPEGARHRADLRRIVRAQLEAVHHAVHRVDHAAKLRHEEAVHHAGRGELQMQWRADRHRQRVERGYSLIRVDEEPFPVERNDLNRDTHSGTRHRLGRIKLM